jgi:hypothetical protein
MHDTKALIHEQNRLLLMGYKSRFREQAIISTPITGIGVCVMGRK